MPEWLVVAGSGDRREVHGVHGQRIFVCQFEGVCDAVCAPVGIGTRFRSAHAVPLGGDRESVAVRWLRSAGSIVRGYRGPCKPPDRSSSEPSTGRRGSTRWSLISATRCPRPANSSFGLAVCDFAGHTDTDEFGAISAREGRVSKEAGIGYATIECLVETGCLRAGDLNPPCAYRSCVLSARGLELLKATPQSVRVTETLGDKLVRLVAEGSMDLAKDAVRAAVALAVDAQS